MNVKLASGTTRRRTGSGSRPGIGRHAGWPTAWRASTILLVVALAVGASASLARAQDGGAAPDVGAPEAGPRSDEDIQRQAQDAIASGKTAEETTEDDEAAAPVDEKSTEIRILDLLYRGGPLMIPILLMSIVVVTFGVERAVALRRNKVIPDALVEELGGISERQGRFDPREAYRVCQRHPSAAANVIRRALLKVGRPLAEVEHATVEASEREASKLYSNVRPIGLAVAITPLMGLFGTVWGMILSFFTTAQLLPGQDKAEALANGIYVALVTTLAGLAVAIPAAVLAHYFEGRIQSLFRDVDDLVQSLMPQLERFEGRMKVRGKRRPRKSSRSSENGAQALPAQILTEAE